jgi:hypothetical protein
VTREEFIEAYCRRSDVQWEWLSQYRDAVPCTCGEQYCEGWAMVPKGSSDQPEGKRDA